MSGEHPNGRKAMDALIKAQRDNGVPLAQAEKRAREVAIRNDRRREEGK